MSHLEPIRAAVSTHITPASAIYRRKLSGEMISQGGGGGGWI